MGEDAKEIEYRCPGCGVDLKDRPLEIRMVEYHSYSGKIAVGVGGGLIAYGDLDTDMCDETDNSYVM